MPHHSENDAARFSPLCRPHEETSCFACCPPIRPPGYDHADHENSIRRELLENTRAFRSQGPQGRPITGLSCWGLGFLDRRGRLVGCLLHPAGNQGRDLRDLTGYGEKCRRELCREAVVFSELTPALAGLVLGLGSGLDSFTYSSPRRNPVFRLLAWGPEIIARLVEGENRRLGLDRETFLRRYAFLARDLDPGRDAYPLLLLLSDLDLLEVSRPDFLSRYRASLAAFIDRNRQVMTLPLDRRPFLHELGLPPSFVAFLRHALGWSRALPAQAEDMRARLMEAMEALKRT